MPKIKKKSTKPTVRPSRSTVSRVKRSKKTAKKTSLLLRPLRHLTSRGFVKLPRVPKLSHQRKKWAVPIIFALVFGAIGCYFLVFSKAASVGNTLWTGNQLYIGQELLSDNHAYRLVFQSDGNLVLYQVADNFALWNSGTAGRGANRVIMQSDGNLVIYNGNSPVWANWKNNAGSNPRLIMQGDGNLVQYVNTTAVWSTDTWRQNFFNYSQKDSRWANSNYPYIPGTQNQSDIAIYRSGCGPTSMAMVATTLLQQWIYPPEIASRYGTRYHSSDGTLRSVYSQFASDYGLRYSSLGSFKTSSGRAAIASALQNGYTHVIIHAGPGTFTGSGHIIVLREYYAGRYLVADPNNTSNNRSFSEAELINYGNLNDAYAFNR
jgi:hypothetical protein